MNRDGILDVLQQPQVGHSAPVLYGAPVNFDDDRDWRRHEQGRHSRRVTTVSGFYICALVYKNCTNVQESSNYDSRLAVVYTDFLLFLGSTMMLSFFLGENSSSLLQPNAV